MSAFEKHCSDDPPPYSKIFASSAPLLEEAASTSASTVFGVARNLTFQYDSSDTFGYSFLIRDSFGCLQARGEVNNFNITLQSVNGVEMLNIIRKNDVHETDVRTFQVSHENKVIGTVRVTENGPAATCLYIEQRNAELQMVVKSLKIGDFAIYHPNVMSSPICNIQLPMPTDNDTNAEKFDGTLMFHPETGITTEEQLLCTAAAIAFRVMLKQKTTKQVNKSDAWVKKCCWGFLIGFIIIIIAIVVFVKTLKKWCRDGKAAGDPHYRYYKC